MNFAVEIKGVTHDFAGEKALRGISLEVPSGTLFGMIGADGAGKSTLFRMAATLLLPQKGSVKIFGQDTRTEFRSIRTRIGYMPQRFSLYGDLTVTENLRFMAQIMDVNFSLREQKIHELLEFTNLAAASDRRASRLSGGMKQKLALCCALIHQPELLLLDEPTVGVDPVTRKDFWDILRNLRTQGSTLLVSTPYMDEAELCDQVALVNGGMILALGTPSALSQSLPGKLWRIHGEMPLHIDAGFQPDAPLIALYSTGGELRALAPQEMAPRTVLKIVRHVLAGYAGAENISRFYDTPETIEPAQVCVEDVFLEKLRSLEAAP